MSNDPNAATTPPASRVATGPVDAPAPVRTERPVESDAPRHADPLVAHEEVRRDAADARREVVQRQKESFGGFKFGAAFFGWLAAMGLAVILTALVSAIGAGIGLAADPQDVDAAAQNAAANADTATLVGAIALAVVLFVSYYAGGYVAGRMARFSGVKQGVAVWIWAIVVAVVTAIAGSRFDVLAQLNGFPRIPLDGGTLTVVGILTLVLALVIPLVAAILGGLAGMRYHRRIDKAGFGN